jgi:MFS family permease
MEAAMSTAPAVVLDRGLEDDWFASRFIVTFTVICALAFVLMIPWELRRSNPMIDLKMVATRQFGACFVVMLITGAILLATTQFLPQLVQQNFGYTATWAGLLLSPGGLVTMVMMFVVGRIAAKVQPKYLIVLSLVIFSICAASNGSAPSRFTAELENTSRPLAKIATCARLPRRPSRMRSGSSTSSIMYGITSLSPMTMSCWTRPRPDSSMTRSLPFCGL